MLVKQLTDDDPIEHLYGSLRYRFQCSIALETQHQTSSYECKIRRSPFDGFISSIYQANYSRFRNRDFRLAKAINPEMRLERRSIGDKFEEHEPLFIEH